jgi:hypothetical protein
MSTGAINLGEIQGLGKALGLLDGSDNFRSGWLSEPGHYLSSVLADETQRNALVQFVGDVLGEQTETDSDGRIWLPIVSNPSPHVTLFLVVDPTPPDYVAIGVGARLTTTAPESRTSVHVPIFRAAKSGHAVPDSILIGHSDAAVITLETEITLGSAPPLGGIGLSIRIPTTAGPAPQFALSLRRLQLPGASQPRDLNVSVSNLAELESSALQLVFGLIRAQADALGAGPLGSLVGLLGLGGGAIPNLPLDRLQSEGVQALAGWFESVMSSPAAKSAWLGQLASLLGAAPGADQISFALGPAQIVFGVRVDAGSGGHSVVTPTLSCDITQGNVRVRAEADLLRLDLATFSVQALPDLSLYAQMGKLSDGDASLLAGDPRVDACRVGITLDQNRRPNFLLAADGVSIAGHSYPTLDLSSPDALAQVGGTILSDVAASLLAQLGPIGDAIKLLVGLTAPPSAPGATRLSPVAFLHDPLGAIQTYWRGLLHDHPSAVADLLTTLRDLISDADQAAIAISGTGTEADPWRLPIAGPVGLDVWSANAGDVLEVALSARYVADNLGQRCTRVETALSVGMVHVDLAGGSAVFLSAVNLQLQARARGTTQAQFNLGPVSVSADFVGLRGSWRPSQGLSVAILAPNLAAQVDGVSVPFTLPVIAADGSVTLDAAGWDLVENFIGLLASIAPVPWVGQLALALGWAGLDPALRPRLRLADLAASAANAIKNWLIALAVEDSGKITDLLESLARTLTGADGIFGAFEGQGIFDDPYRLPILPVAGSPELTVWLLPDGPDQPVTTAPDSLRSWRPGSPGLGPVDLAYALGAEAASAPDIQDLVSGRPDLATGFSLLATRWTGSDGKIVPPASDPAGITTHSIDNVTADQLSDQVDLADLLGAAPATVMHIAVVVAGAPLPWPDAPADHVIDIRGAGLAPESFPQPTATAGEWFVALAERADARLASGDTDGIAGQAARLARVVSPFSSVAGDLVFVAQEGAGHAALAAANTLNFVHAVVTLGTPFTPVAFTILDDQPAADAFRLLRVVLPPLDPNQTDDFDLALGRGMVNALANLLPQGDPGRELRPPAVPVVPRAGLAVHAFFGVIDDQTVQRAMTAIVAAGLSERAAARAAVRRRPVTGGRLGVRMPVAAGGTGITASGHAMVELCGADMSGGGPVVSTARTLHVHLEVRRTGSWLVGGPGTGLGSGPRVQQDLRWLECNLHLPFGAADASTEIVLHEPNIFTINRERWIVQPTGSTPSTTDVVTPALPEVRVLLSLVADQLNAAAGSSPQVDALLGLLRGVGVLSATAGSVPDAVDHLLHDPAAQIASALADATQRAGISTAINRLLTGVPGLTVDLEGRRIVLDSSGSPGSRGMVSWTAHLEATAQGTLSALVTLGSAGTTAAGGAVLRLQTGPLRVQLEWHRPGLTTPELIPLWPAPDAAALARVLVLLIPAQGLAMGLEYLRALDDTARPFVDAALDAVGLLAPPGTGQRAVLLPLGLLRDPVGWFQHQSAFGGAGGFSAPRVVGLLDALKPIIGVAGNPGEWNLSTGVTVVADSSNGNLRLGARVDTSGFAPIVTAAGRLVATGTFTLTLPPGVAPKPELLLSFGLAGAAPGRRAIYFDIGSNIRVYLRPDTGADLSLYPDPPGLGQLAQTAVNYALPFILDQVAALTGATLQGRVGAVVRAVGDALNLRSGAPAHFDSAKLRTWAADPAGSLVAALPSLTAAALQAIADALGPNLPAGVTVTAASNSVTVTASSVSLTWQPSPFQITCGGTITGIPGLGRANISIVLDHAGLNSLTAQAGPATIDAGGVTLRPFVATVAGAAPAGGRRVQFGLAANDPGTSFVGGRWNLDGSGLTLVTSDGTTEHTDAEHVALGLLEAVLDLAASFAIRTAPLQQLLGNHVGSSTVREILRGVLLEDVAAPTHLDSNLFDTSKLLGRVQKLAVNLAGANPSVNVGGGLSIGLSKSGAIVQLTLGVNGRIPLTSGDIVVSVEADSRWIQGQPPAGVAIGILDSGSMTFAPSLAANGLGLRIAKSSGPLLDLGFTLGSVAVHLFGSVTAGGVLSGGVQVQLSDLAVGVAGAQGGNAVAKGLMGDGGSGQNKLAPSFSPALAVQKHGGDAVQVSLRAGDGDGPWWLVIQKGFGPIYMEQVGFAVKVPQGPLQSISLLLDGRVSLFGLTAAVDDLQISLVIASDASLFDPSRWAIDLGGLAIDADVAGVTLAGGLRKFGDGDNVEYVGMLLGRFAVYGLSVYGGYGSAVVDGQRFSAFFAFGAVNGPIGGPPAFFITGIGGGLGINRDLIFPGDFAHFGDFPLLKALDPSAQPSSDPMAELASLRDFFPMKRGEFWFAAGISFNSFVLVDGIAVISVKIGDGLEIALLGLARMALPRPEFALVSIELGLLARFSTKEGVLWIQAQLTDNSWLLYPDVRLTGGFAFVTWYKGPNAGQFVLTIGGYHPHFHHDGYPLVPRLGFHWNVSDFIVIKGESYFALTSEAVMGGGKLTASAHFGPAWAEVIFGADGIVYFDPFRFEVEVYARISAGVTIDVWIGEITISISLGAKIIVAGPKFHGTAEFDVGPISITVSFGDSNQSQKVYLSWEQFVRKYLEEASPGVARVISAITGKGSLPPGTGAGGTTDTGTADGSADKPFVVLSEFELTFATTVPTQAVAIGSGAPTNYPPSSILGIAPVNVNAANTKLTLQLQDSGGANQFGAVLQQVDQSTQLVQAGQGTVLVQANQDGAFPVGVWGPPQPDDDRKVPAGNTIQAVDSVHFDFKAQLQGTLPKEMAYNQIEAGTRKPLPFVNIQRNRAAFLAAANGLSNLLPAAAGAAATYAAAKPWLAAGDNSRTAVAAIERERTSPPRLGSLTQDLATAEMPIAQVQFPVPVVKTPIDFAVRSPVAIAVLTAAPLQERPQVQTTVSADKTSPRVAVPTLDSVRAQLPLAVAAKLVRVATPVTPVTSTVVAMGAVPFTRFAGGATAAIAARGGFSDTKARLDALTGTLAGSTPGVQTAAAPAGPDLHAGEIAVLQLPNARHDTNPSTTRPRLMVDGQARIVAFSHGGDVLLDVPGDPKGSLIPQGTERVAVLALGEKTGAADGLLGWHSGQELAYVGWQSALAPGAVVRAEGATVRSTRQRFRAGWLHGADLVAGSIIVVTRFTQPIQTVAIFIDDLITSEAARGLSFALDGADRVVGQDRQPLPPTLVVAGNRSALIYAIQPQLVPAAAAVISPITISVASQSGWHVAGVMAGNEAVDFMARRITRHGMDGLLQPLIASHQGVVNLQWSGATPGAPPTGGYKPSGPGTQPAKPASPGKTPDKPKAPRRARKTSGGKKKNGARKKKT